MSKCYYHGFDSHPFNFSSSFERMLKLLDEGIRTRNKARSIQDDDLEHICLYKKNDDYDYHQENAFLHSAKGGWIVNCFVFIVDPTIEAFPVPEEECKLVDEWRCYQEIPPSKFVGIAIPFQVVQEQFDIFNNTVEEKEDNEKSRRLLEKVLERAEQMHIPVVDSSQEFFTDQFDEEYGKKQEDEQSYK